MERRFGIIVTLFLKIKKCLVDEYWDNINREKQFSVHKKCENKFDCLVLHEMSLIRELAPPLIVQSHSDHYIIWNDYYIIWNV